MEYISVKAWAEMHGVSERIARNYCAQNKIDGAFLVGKTWKSGIYHHGQRHNLIHNCLFL